MEFKDIFDVLKDLISEKMGLELSIDDYDALIVKKMADSNCISHDGGGKQTHIAITGSQMDMFPFLYSKKFVENDEKSMKNFFVFKAPIVIYRSNCEYLGYNKSIDFENSEQLVEEICVYPRKGGDQVQLSMKSNGDSENFIKYRELITQGMYWIVLKRKNVLFYETITLKSEDSQLIASADKGFFYAQRNSSSTKDSTFVTKDSLIELNREHVQELSYKTKKKFSNRSLNRILFGAPGTGKSYTLDKEMSELLGSNLDNYERVTFHPDYTFSQFVGTYKPVPVVNDEGKEEISYQYVPGPFIRSYIKALRSVQTNNDKPYLLLIEEINRSKVAAVFGDVFQLLDRDIEGVSEYPIRTSEDLRQYLAKELSVSEDQVSTLRLPNNLFIWATMNSADQGVFPMDTAFKRRWDFEYLELDKGENKIEGYKFKVGSETYEWNALRKALNEVLSEEYDVNEDKLMGPFFIKLDAYKTVEEDGKLLDSKFINVFKNKVLMYLFDDAVKQKRKKFFQGMNRYSVICKSFEKNGLKIFDNKVSEKYDAEFRSKEFGPIDKD